MKYIHAFLRAERSTASKDRKAEAGKEVGWSNKWRGLKNTNNNFHSDK